VLPLAALVACLAAAPSGEFTAKVIRELAWSGT
jgi:hypothetical protein